MIVELALDLLQVDSLPLSLLFRVKLFNALAVIVFVTTELIALVFFDSMRGAEVAEISTAPAILAVWYRLGLV